MDEFEQELKEAKEELEAGQLRWDAEKVGWQSILTSFIETHAQSGEDLGFTSLGGMWAFLLFRKSRSSNMLADSGIDELAGDVATREDVCLSVERGVS